MLKYDERFYKYSNVPHEWLPIGRRWKAYYLIIGSLVFFITYITAALMPYAGPLRVCSDRSANWSINNFLGDADKPLPERVMLLPDCRDAFNHRIHLVNQARKSIYFVCFVATPGWSPEIFLGALIAAADRDVTVNVIVDAKFFDFGGRYAAPLSSHPNINYYEFNPINLLRPWYINHALHDKIMIVDDEFLIIGGRNLGDKYPDFGGFQAEYYNDLEVLVYRPYGTCSIEDNGGIIAETRAYARSIAENSLTRVRSSSNNSNNHAAGERMVGTYRDYLNYMIQKGFIGEDYSGPDYSKDGNLTHNAYNISLLYNPVEGTRKEPVIAYNLLRLTRESDRVLVHTPYVVLTRRNKRILSEAIATTSEFTIVTNSMASVGDLWAYGSYHIRRRDVARAGHDTSSDFRLYEFQHPTHSLHLKAYAFDERLTAIGAYNLSERSTRIITDSMLVIDSPELNAAVRENAQRFIDGSLRVDRNGRYYNPPDRPYEDRIEEVQPSFWKNVRLTLQGILFEPFRFLV